MSHLLEQVQQGTRSSLQLEPMLGRSERHNPEKVHRIVFQQQLLGQLVVRLKRRIEKQNSREFRALEDRRRRLAVGNRVSETERSLIVVSKSRRVNRMALIVCFALRPDFADTANSTTEDQSLLGPNSCARCLRTRSTLSVDHLPL